MHLMKKPLHRSAALALVLCACGPVTRLLPQRGDLAATQEGHSARLRVYYSPPLRGLLPTDTVALYVELRNHSNHPLYVRYADLALVNQAGAVVRPLRPGDVFRPSRLSPGQRRLLASIIPESSLRSDSTASSAPPWLRQREVEDRADAVDFLAPTARYRIHGTFVMQNDLGTGPQLSRGGWPLFGTSPLGEGQGLTLFDLLKATLQDGDLFPGGERGGFLFFPRAAVGAALGLRWQVTEVAAPERPSEQLRVPLAAAR